MDDLAPAPAQRTSDNGGRSPGQNFTARRKPAKNMAPEAAHKQDPDPRLAPEPVADHEIDVLA
ncbi:MAG: hypothetical protein ACLQVG_26225 [Terriglobia bacterium]